MGISTCLEKVPHFFAIFFVFVNLLFISINADICILQVQWSLSP